MVGISRSSGVPQFRLRRMMVAVAFIAFLLAVTAPLTRPWPRRAPPPAVKVVPIPSPSVQHPFATFPILTVPTPRRVADGDEGMIVEPRRGDDGMAVPPRREEPEF